MELVKFYGRKLTIVEIELISPANGITSNPPIFFEGIVHKAIFYYDETYPYFKTALYWREQGAVIWSRSDYVLTRWNQDEYVNFTLTWDELDANKLYEWKIVTYYPRQGIHYSSEIRTFTPAGYSINIETSNDNPDVNEHFVISGYVTDKTTNSPISNTKVEIYDKNPDNWQSVLMGTTYTDASGKYTFDMVYGDSYYGRALGLHKFYTKARIYGNTVKSDTITIRVGTTKSVDFDSQNTNPSKIGPPYYDDYYPPYNGGYVQIYNLKSFFGEAKYFSRITGKINVPYTPSSGDVGMLRIRLGYYEDKDTYGYPFKFNEVYHKTFTGTQTYDGVISFDCDVKEVGGFGAGNQIPILHSSGTLYYDAPINEFKTKAIIVNGEYTDKAYTGMNNIVCKITVKNNGNKAGYIYARLYENVDAIPQEIETQNAYLEPFETTTFTFYMYIPAGRTEPYYLGIKVRGEDEADFDSMPFSMTGVVG